ncbi:MAG TPA: prepilin-type N-terminal cleavage/methylation domain-containing protein [Bacilli bacterium]|nr:prepilin-type N-terminal cleavage/methylation domain-containing protein [Bacilli bacterium]
MKKGFTLIELLAVILILGIIALIAIPVVNNIIKEAKKGSFKTTAENIVKSVETKCQLQQVKGENITREYNLSDKNIKTKMNIKGDIPSVGSVSVNSDCTVTYLNVADTTYTATLNNDKV